MDYTNTPKTVSFSGKDLATKKAELCKYAEECEHLKKKAEKVMSNATYSVVYKKLVPPTNNPHDYMTMGPYWWPDPDKADGLPYIRRDGVHNPDASDRNKFGSMADDAVTLAISAYLFEREDWARRSLEIIRVWHVDKETRMNPHAEFAQAIPGICSGRGIGLIDFRESYKVFNACEILYSLGVMKEETYLNVKEWYVEFINWMITSEKGIYEDNYFNNHGVWYDVQILSAAIFTNRPELAKRVAANAYRRRHLAQIKENGAQPHELERTNAMSYSTMNLFGLSLIAKMAVALGHKDYIKSEGDGDTLLERAAEFLYPYTKDQSDFPYQQIKPSDFSATMCRSLNAIFEITGNKHLKKMENALEKPEHIVNLLVD